MDKRGEEGRETFRQSGSSAIRRETLFKIPDSVLAPAGEPMQRIGEPELMLDDEQARA